MNVMKEHLLIRCAFNATIIFICLLLCMLYEPMRYRNKKYMIGNQLLEIKRGVFIEKEDKILMKIIKGMEVKQYFYQIPFKIYNIVFYINGKNVIMYDVNENDIDYLKNIFNRIIKNEI